ncbi:MULTISPECIES: FAD-dependent oxidoreductase [unclassified Sphingobium]|uniref:FAD-dependent oxidoreductase n=1 Tax=unclassified Sphingobium TaxID=2611147 RepID=UPI0022246E2F|nr:MULTISPECIES: FAD-dependent oxidoreductase [unclassified Sphingobium]MCW2380656.1 2-polyprenyl-6-methoxyphenol hydroxylase-like FAD-dependent oxidoreductase [Sphingobium sp. B2D3B]MCW2399236.1 2-polyprenyl-6-methoxyphenol hydroxylase-like FAD-dependent oxidoreductase [Sphingobium sp. B2D3C]
MQSLNILVIGGGIGGLTSAIALRKQGFSVTVIERDPSWSVYGVGIIQQGNVLRAAHMLGILDDYAAAGVGFDAVEVFAPNGVQVARVPSPRLLPDYPANLGVGRRQLQKVLGDAAQSAGAEIRLGVTAQAISDGDDAVEVAFSDGSAGRFDLVIGADGVFSKTREMILPDAEKPQFTGQAVWRYNLPRPADLDALQVYNGPIGAGLVPISPDLMYLYVTTPEPGNPWYPREGLAAAMRAKLAGCAPALQALAEQIVDDEEVVYRPLEGMLVEGPWSRGRVVLIGDAVHATTPHLGQGAGMAIEDSIVLAEELARHASVEEAFAAYHDRRFERCAYIVRASLAICMGQIGKGPPVDNAKATAEMFERTAEPI